MCAPMGTPGPQRASAELQGRPQRTRALQPDALRWSKDMPLCVRSEPAVQSRMVLGQRPTEDQDSEAAEDHMLSRLGPGPPCTHHGHPQQPLNPQQASSPGEGSHGLSNMGCTYAGPSPGRQFHASGLSLQGGLTTCTSTGEESEARRTACYHSSLSLHRSVNQPKHDQKNFHRLAGNAEAVLGCDPGDPQASPALTRPIRGSSSPGTLAPFPPP